MFTSKLVVIWVFLCVHTFMNIGDDDESVLYSDGCTICPRGLCGYRDIGNCFLHVYTKPKILLFFTKGGMFGGI